MSTPSKKYGSMPLTAGKFGRSPGWAESILPTRRQNWPEEGSSGRMSAQEAGTGEERHWIA